MGGGRLNVELRACAYPSQSRGLGCCALAVLALELRGCHLLSTQPFRCARPAAPLVLPLTGGVSRPCFPFYPSLSFFVSFSCFLLFSANSLAGLHFCTHTHTKANTQAHTPACQILQEIAMWMGPAVGVMPLWTRAKRRRMGLKAPRGGPCWEARRPTRRVRCAQRAAARPAMAAAGAAGGVACCTAAAAAATATLHPPIFHSR